MATVLRSWSYQHQWLYDSISRLAALAVGGERRFHHLPLQNLTISHETQILDLCCGGGQATRFLVEYSQNVTGLDVSPLSLARAKRNVPQAKYVEGLAEEMPLPDNQFDLVHISVALHEMPPEILRQILKEVYRVLKPGGILTLMDFHKPTNFLFWPGVAIFLWLFETETAWQLLEEDLVGLLEETGFTVCDGATHPRSDRILHCGGSLQVIQVRN